jgi:hypothetical protein
MKQALLEHIEAKVINFLRDSKAPVHVSQVAVRIQEKREDTLQAIQRLVRNQTLKGVQDLAFFNSTGETTAYVLADAALLPMTVDPSLPIPPPQPTPPATRGPLLGRS